MRDSPLPEPIVFFDGVCGLCNRTVDFLLKHDRQGMLKFAPLQGETARERLDERDRDLNSIVFLENGQVFRKSTAIVRILKRLDRPWGAAGTLLWLVPGPLRDFGYNCVARVRYRVFGKRETCRLPTPEQRSRFLP